MVLKAPNYDSVAKWLHWLIGLAIIGMLALGWTMMNMPKEYPGRFAMFQLHKSIGITILLLSFVRLGWRLMHPVPALPSHMAKWEIFAARATHWAFYILMIAMPITGWVIVSSSSMGLPTILYGIIPWPHVPGLQELPNKQEINQAFEQVHSNLAFLIAGLLALHIGAALKHHFIVKDDILTRMTPQFMNGFLNRLQRLL